MSFISQEISTCGRGHIQSLAICTFEIQKKKRKTKKQNSFIPIPRYAMTILYIRSFHLSIFNLHHSPFNLHHSPFTLPLIPATSLPLISAISLPGSPHFLPLGFPLNPPFFGALLPFFIPSFASIFLTIFFASFFA
jgi:hypothetical protein